MGKDLPTDQILYQIFKEIDHIFFDEIVESYFKWLRMLFIFNIFECQDYALKP